MAQRIDVELRAVNRVDGLGVSISAARAIPSPAAIQTRYTGTTRGR